MKKKIIVGILFVLAALAGPLPTPCGAYETSEPVATTDQTDTYKVSPGSITALQLFVTTASANGVNVVWYQNNSAFDVAVGSHPSVTCADDWLVHGSSVPVQPPELVGADDKRYAIACTSTSATADLRIKRSYKSAP